MKKAGTILGVLAAVLVLALIVIFLSLNSLVKTGVETVGPQVTKTDVKLGSVSLSPLSGSGQLKGLFVGNPAGYSSPSAIKVGEVRVKLQPKSLLTDTIVIDEIYIESPEITLEKMGKNLKEIQANVDAMAGGGTNDTAKAQKKLIVKDLTVKGGKVIVGSVTVPLPDVHLTNIGVGGKPVTAAGLINEILKPTLSNVMNVAGEALKKVGQTLENVGKEGVDKAKGLLDVFKKK
jgi:hypothetical protein